MQGALQVFIRDDRERKRDHALPCAMREWYKTTYPACNEEKRK